jgi:hypothetical protein
LVLVEFPAENFFPKMPISTLLEGLILPDCIASLSNSPSKYWYTSIYMIPQNIIQFKNKMAWRRI